MVSVKCRLVTGSFIAVSLLLRRFAAITLLSESSFSPMVVAASATCNGHMVSSVTLRYFFLQFLDDFLPVAKGNALVVCRCELPPGELRPCPLPSTGSRIDSG